MAYSASDFVNDVLSIAIDQEIVAETDDLATQAKQLIEYMSEPMPEYLETMVVSNMVHKRWDLWMAIERQVRFSKNEPYHAKLMDILQGEIARLDLLIAEGVAKIELEGDDVGPA